jgi:hypothetical protein
MTYTLIAHQELGSAQGSIVFNSIPQIFTDLKLVISDRSNRAATNDAILINLNGTSSSGRRLFGTGTTVVSTADTGVLNTADTSTANTFSNIEVYILNYSVTTRNKSWSADGVTENNGTNAYPSIVAGLYASNSAVTSITLVNETGTAFLQNSSATLYGITAGSSGGVVVS